MAANTDTVGRAFGAAIRRFGPQAAPWQLASVITAAGILAAGPSPRWHRAS